MHNRIIGIAADYRGCCFCECVYEQEKIAIVSLDTLYQPSLEWLRDQLAAINKPGRLVFGDIYRATRLCAGLRLDASEPRCLPLDGQLCLISAINEHRLEIRTEHSRIASELKGLGEFKPESLDYSLIQWALIRSVGEMYDERFTAPSRKIAAYSSTRTLTSLD